MKNPFGGCGEFLLVLAIILGMYAISAHGATTSSAKKNSFGAVISYDNPNTYIMGIPIHGAYVTSGARLATNVRFQPSYTFGMLTQEVLFCGDHGSDFNIRGPLVVTYRTRAHEALDGIGCHDLISVDRVKDKRLPGQPNE
jgi:hypothetical protein